MIKVKVYRDDLMELRLDRKPLIMIKLNDMIEPSSSNFQQVN